MKIEDIIDAIRHNRIRITDHADEEARADHNGVTIRVADLPEDWEAPSPRPQWSDEGVFR